MATAATTERNEAIENIRAFVNPGDTVYCVLRHVSSSGMSRTIDLITIHDNDVRWIGRLASKVLGYSYDTKKEGIKISGAGMDMGFALVYELSRSLFDDGYKLNSRWL